MLRFFCILLLLVASNCMAGPIVFSGSAQGYGFESRWPTDEMSPFETFLIDFKLVLDLNSDWIFDGTGRKYQNLDVLSASSSLDPLLSAGQFYEARYSPSELPEYSGTVFLSLSREGFEHYPPEILELLFWSLTSETGDLMFIIDLDPDYQLYGSNLTIAPKSSIYLWNVVNNPGAYPPYIGSLNTSLEVSRTAVNEPSTSYLFLIALLSLLICSKSYKKLPWRQDTY